jgi:AraC-like DNA-binding protein
MGFSSHSHFTGAFRAELGVAPSSVCDPARR